MADDQDLAERSRRSVAHEHTIGAKFNPEVFVTPKKPPKPKAPRKQARAKAKKD